MWNLVSSKCICYQDCLFFLFLCLNWWSDLIGKDRQQAPPHLALCSSSSKVQGIKMGNLLDISSTNKLFQASPVLVNLLSVYHIILGN